MATVGRPPEYDSPEKMEEAIQDYFLFGVKLRKISVGRPPNNTVVLMEVPTITGLCYHIGFDSRQSFYDYENKPEFSYIVKRARLFIEREYEEHLTQGNTVGAIFALKNMGWKDKFEQEHSGSIAMTPITGMNIL
jgi:hypothetical protein